MELQDITMHGHNTLLFLADNKYIIPMKLLSKASDTNLQRQQRFHAYSLCAFSSRTITQILQEGEFQEIHQQYQLRDQSLVY